MRSLFATTLGQVFAVSVCSWLASLLLFMALMARDPVAVRQPSWVAGAVQRTALLVDYVESITPAERVDASLLAFAQGRDLSARVTDHAAACTSNSTEAQQVHALLRAQLPRHQQLTVYACESDETAQALQILVRMGAQTLEIRTGGPPATGYGMRFPSVRALILVLVSGLAMSIWVIWRIALPLRRLSQQVDAFGQMMTPEPIEEKGSAEIRVLARNFNQMQQRIAEMLQARTRALAAIGHDLRAPLTRMRLQTDSSTEAMDVGKLRRNIDLMQTMLTSALSFLNGTALPEAREWIDLDALLSTLCDEYEESGASIRYEGPGHIPFHCHPDSIQRALVNLIENALHFGSTATIRASQQGETIMVEVEDDGPGIPAECLRSVLEPFVRLDRSRNSRPGSVGLGLSIVQDIVQAHSGSLMLSNRSPAGLVARVVFTGTALRKPGDAGE